MAHVFPALPDYAKVTLWLDERNGLSFIHWKDESEPYMALWWHRAGNADGWCLGSFAWRKPDERLHGALWQLESWQPLTISPSLHCLDCQAHGFIQQGHWVPV